MRADRRGPWVVYLQPVHGRPDPLRAVCDQEEWDAMERATPGARTLVRGGIANEGEAELLARGTSGDRAAPRQGRPNAAARPPVLPVDPPDGNDPAGPVIEPRPGG